MSIDEKWELAVETDWLVREALALFRPDEEAWVVPAATPVFFRTEDLGRLHWQMEIEMMHPQGDAPSLAIGHSFYELSLGRREAPHLRLSLYRQVAEATGRFPFPAGSWERVTLTRADGRVCVATSFGFEREVADPMPEQRVKDFLLDLPAGMRFRRFALRVGGRKPARRQPVARRRLLRSVTIDFNDDVVPAPWTQGTIAEQMEHYRKADIRRVYFLPTAKPEDGYWRMPPELYPRHREHILQSAENLGDFLPVFASAAKAHGIEFIAVYKPFDQAFEKDGLRFSQGGPEYRQHFHSLSGLIARSTDWLRHHPGLRMQRHPGDLKAVAACGPIRRLVLEAETACGPAVEFSLWASQGNERYTRLEGLAIGREGTRWEWEIPPGTPSYLAVQREPGSTGRFGNRLGTLLRAYDQAGKPIPVSLAVVSDVSRGKHAGAFPDAAFYFDVNFASRQPVDTLNSYWWMCEETPVAIVKGVEPWLLGAPSPLHSEVRSHWLSEVARCLDAGCDGVDLRIANHNRTMNWECYGYDTPQLRESAASAREVRTVLGHAWSLFVEEASRLVRAHGRRLHLHLEPGFRPATLPCEMNIAFEWRKWLENRWADEVTLMTNFPATGLMPEMIRAAQDQNIPVHLRPYFNSMLRGRHADRLIGQLLEETRACGLDGLNLYENAAFFRLTPDGELRCTFPEAWARLTS